MNAEDPEEYLNSADEVRELSFKQLYDPINQNIPKGFVEQMSYGNIG